MFKIGDYVTVHKVYADKHDDITWYADSVLSVDNNKILLRLSDAEWNLDGTMITSENDIFGGPRYYLTLEENEERHKNLLIWGIKGVDLHQIDVSVLEDIHFMVMGGMLK